MSVFSSQREVDEFFDSLYRLPAPAQLPPPAPPVASYAPGVAPRVELPKRPRMGHPRVAPRVAPTRFRIGDPRVAPRVAPTRSRMGHPRRSTRGLTSHIEYLDEDALEDPELQQALGMSAAAGPSSSYTHAAAAAAGPSSSYLPNSDDFNSDELLQLWEADPPAVIHAAIPANTRRRAKRQMRELQMLAPHNKPPEPKNKAGKLYKTRNKRMRRGRKSKKHRT